MPQPKCRRNGDEVVLYCSRIKEEGASARRVNLDAESMDIIRETTETLKQITNIECSLGVLIRRSIRALQIELLQKMEALALADLNADPDDFFADYDSFGKAERKMLFMVAGVEDK
jgi:hypothetical protein